MGAKLYHENTNQKKAKAAILISDRADVKVRKVIRDWGALNNDKRSRRSKKTQQFLTRMYLTTECQTTWSEVW